MKRSFISFIKGVHGVPCWRLAVVLHVALIFFPRSSWAIFHSKKDNGFGLAEVTAMAKELSQKPYQKAAEVPEPFHSLTFDQWRDIRYKPKAALWRNEGLPFNIEFFHAGFLYNVPIIMNTIEGGQARPFAFNSRLFDYGQTGLEEKVPQDLGYAGFRIHYPLNRSSYKDEVAVFLGASYFRAVAKNEVYGLSGRGIAIDTALSSGEQFPWFKQFWILKPKHGDRTMTIYALLDGESLTGAYQFVIRPGKQTLVQVDAHLFLRQDVERLGIAPLTGMFYYGENKGGKGYDDFRPELHDCDGLSLSIDRHEWIWRPLVNPDRLFVNVFQVKTLHGFGLMQRDENYDHYLDLEQHYEKRPSVWITPHGDWGSGSVDLIQIPTVRESDDNIGAFWVPDHKPAPKERMDVSYSMLWSSAKDLFPPLGHVTFTGSMHLNDGRRQFILEFNGPKLADLDSSSKITAAVSAPDGVQVEDVVVQKNEVNQGWRLAFKVKTPEKPTVEQIIPQKKEAVELRASLQKNGHPLTETWSYAFDRE